MATKGTRYEYKLVDLPDEGSEEEIVAILNKLGQEGWWLISVSHGGHHDDQLWGSCWMVRAV
jgi:hypothetical protein